MKFQPAVYSQKWGLEVDALVTHLSGKELASPIAIEVNGAYHYSRNSEKPLGKDLVKAKILCSEGLQVLVLPYFDLYILEDAARTGYISDCLLNLFE